MVALGRSSIRPLSSAAEGPLPRLHRRLKARAMLADEGRSSAVPWLLETVKVLVSRAGTSPSVMM